MTRNVISSYAFAFAGLLGAACPSASEDECDVGAESCACTPAGTCDPGLTCASNTCVDLAGGSGEGSATEASATEDSATEASATEASATEDSATEASATEDSATADGSSDGSASEGTSDDGEPDACAAAGCALEWCDSLRTWCGWTLENDFGSYQEDFSSCEDCVTTFQTDFENGVLTGVYCPAVFDCWADCVADVGGAGNDAVLDCSHANCIGDGVDLCG